MNSLSWMIYLADTLDTVRSIFGQSATVGILFYGLWVVLPFRHMLADMEGAKARPVSVWPFAVLFGILIVSAAIPRKETIYLIAASEIGAKAAETEMARDVYDIVRRELKKLKEPLK